MKKVITYGTFDLLHYGHIRLLERAKALGDYLIVGVTSDEFDRARGKLSNRETLEARMAAVRETGLADEIIVEAYDGQKSDDIKKYGIDVFTVGSDWVGHFDYLKPYCEVVYLPRTDGVSSTDIRENGRGVEICVQGEFAIGKKFTRECTFVNGVTIVKNADADAIYLLTPPEEHEQQIFEALSAGKNVLCESPVAVHRDACRALFEMAKERNLVLMEGIKTAYSPAFYALLQIARSGEIGDILSVDATCTSMQYLNDAQENRWSTVGAWGPTALLPIFEILGTDYRDKRITTWLLNEENCFDGFTKIDFTYDNAVASVKVAKAAKAEGELVITGTKGYIYVPAPWWKNGTFEIRYEDQSENRRFTYPLDGEGIRTEIAAFAQAITDKETAADTARDGKVHPDFRISREISEEISAVMEDFRSGKAVYLKGSSRNMS